MTNDWIEHNGGPQPVGDGVWVERKDGHYETECAPAGAFEWVGEEFKFHIINQHLIKAARKEGIELGLEAAARALDGPTLRLVCDAIRALNPDTFAREAALDQLTSEAQADNMGYDNEPR